MEKDMKVYDFYTELDSIEPATEQHVKIIKNILKKATLESEISLEFEGMDISISIDHITPFHVFEKTRKFKINKNLPVIKYKKKKIDMYMFIGAWSNNPSIKNSHISIYTSSSEIGGERFCQIELSDCVEDDNYVYILKNISNLAGNGAIARLNKYSLPKDDQEKRSKDLHDRRKELVDRLNSEVITYDNKDWLCIYKFDKDKLNDSNYHNEFLHRCMTSIIKYAFTIESIIVEAKVYGQFKPNSKRENYITTLPTDVIRARANKAKKIPISQQSKQTTYFRDKYIIEYAKRRANGVCQLCKKEAPFLDKDKNPYLEVHHIQWLSNGGEDSIENTIALCPNCHKKVHILDEKKDIEYLKKANLIDYIEISESPGEAGGNCYTIRIYNDGTVVDNRGYLVDKNGDKVNKVKTNVVDRLIDEIDDFCFKVFELKEILWCTCNPTFSIEVKYVGGSINKIDFDSGSSYENTKGNNGKDIKELNIKLKEILGIKDLD